MKSESEVAQSCPTLSDPMDCSLPDSSIHGIFQAEVLESGAIAFSKATVYGVTKSQTRLSDFMIHEITSVPKGQKLYDSTCMKYPGESNSKKERRMWLPGAEGNLSFMATEFH